MGEVLGNVSGDDVVHGTRGVVVVVVVVVGLVKACGVVGWFADGVDSCWYRAATAEVSSTYSNDTSMYVCWTSIFLQLQVTNAPVVDGLRCFRLPEAYWYSALVLLRNLSLGRERMHFRPAIWHLLHAERLSSPVGGCFSYVFTKLCLVGGV